MSPEFPGVGAAINQHLRPAVDPPGRPDVWGGEALGFRWSDVDLAAENVRIEWAIGFVNHRPLEGEPKPTPGAGQFTYPALRSRR